MNRSCRVGVRATKKGEPASVPLSLGCAGKTSGSFFEVGPRAVGEDRGGWAGAIKAGGPGLRHLGQKPCP